MSKKVALCHFLYYQRRSKLLIRGMIAYHIMEFRLSLQNDKQGTLSFVIPEERGIHNEIN